PGVREEDRAEIFNAFVSHKDGGMGMGLAICRSIAEAHHGRIEVGRDAALGGARFTVWLPLADDDAPPELPATPTQPATAPDLSNATAPAAPTSPKERHAPRRHSHR
ncbi:MAG: ATP-binding protein, partial [Polaromonas sp.]|nr:ATP-binding protein [Polaromonas sp.]